MVIPLSAIANMIRVFSNYSKLHVHKNIIVDVAIYSFCLQNDNYSQLHQISKFPMAPSQ